MMEYNLTAELFSELAIGILIFALRFYARWKYSGLRDFGLDDVFAGFAVVGDHRTPSLVNSGINCVLGILDSRIYFPLHLW